MSVALASAADARYGSWLLNLVGSVHHRSDIFDRIVAYDLGLTPFQRRLLDGVRGVEVRTVPAFVPHWRQGRTWKTWIWTHLEADTAVWLDAGVTVLRPLRDFITGTDERGYFVVSQGHPAHESIPTDYYERYGLPPEFGNRPSIAAGILAFRRDSAFFTDVVVPTAADAAEGLSLGFSADEVTKLNRGLDKLDEVIVRDCPLFRHEQTLLTIHFYRATRDPHVADVYKYGGWLSPHDHPEQVIWSHRRRGDYRFLPLVPYRLAVAPIGIAWGTAVYLRGRARHLRWLLRPAVYRNLSARFRARLRSLR